MDDVLTTL